MNKFNLIVYSILVLVFIVYNVVIFDIGAKHNKQKQAVDDLEELVDRLKHDLKTSQERIDIADSIAAIEIGKLREDMVVLSKLRELTLSQVKNVQKHLEYEKHVRDSIGNTLIEW
jgi:hypothetical protein